MSAIIDAYVLIRSWHRISHGADREGLSVVTRCGRTARIVGVLTGAIDVPGEPIEVHATASELPLMDRSCETCLRLSALDAEKAA